jgi:hypothetical protein
MFLVLLAICVVHQKIDHFNIIDLLEPLLLSRTSFAVSPPGNSHGPLIIQFRKNLRN